MKKPSLQFYPGDWRKDPSVNCLSLAARGLWFEMLMLMHESPRRGYLTMAPQQIARSVGATLSEVKLRLGELQFCNTFSIDEAGVIFNRRMVRDEEISAERSNAGSKGAAKRWVLPSVCHDKADGKNKDLPLPLEDEGEVETEIEIIQEPEISEIMENLAKLYAAAGVPIPPKHFQLCTQLVISIPQGKRMRVQRYVKHMLDSGRWSSAAKTKGLLNLLRDGDWDVPIVERTIPAPTSGKSSEIARAIGRSARERAAVDPEAVRNLEQEAAPWIAQNPGKTVNDFVDWKVTLEATDAAALRRLGS